MNRSLFNRSSRLIHGGARLSDSSVLDKEEDAEEKTYASFIDVSRTTSDAETSVVLDGPSKAGTEVAACREV